MLNKQIDTWTFTNDKGEKFLGVQEGAKGYRLVNGCGYTGLRSHNGWYADAHQDNVYQAAYWLLPARKGYNVAVLGYYDRDAGCYIFEIGNTDKYLVDSFECDDYKTDFLRRADSIAEIAAEEAKDSDIKEYAKMRIEDTKEELSELRLKVIALIKEIKIFKVIRADKAAFPAIRTALCAQVKDLLNERADKYAFIAKCTDDPYSLHY